MQDRSHRHPLARHVATQRCLDRGRAAARVACGVIACGVIACSGAPPHRVTFKTAHTEAPHKRLARALRLAASGRVQARAGLYDEASESLRLAYGIHPDLTTLTDHADAAERAGHFGQAHAAWREVLRHELDEPNRTKATAEAERLAAMVPADHMPVLITVSPAHAIMTLERTQDGRHRTVRSDGVLWLKAGAWQAATSAAGYKSELSGFRVGRRRSTAFAVTLAPGERALRIAGSHEARRPGEHARSGRPRPTGATNAPGADPGALEGSAPSGADPDGIDPDGIDPDGIDPDGIDPDGIDPDGIDPDGTGPMAIVDGAAQPAAPGGGLAKWGPIVTAGLGVAVLGAGGYFAFNAAQNANVANGLSPTRPDYKRQLARYADAASGRVQLANTLFIAGGALAAVGTVWWLLAPRSTDVAADHPLRPSTMTLTGRGFVARWTF